mgnify:CR=1 FL=1
MVLVVAQVIQQQLEVREVPRATFEDSVCLEMMNALPAFLSRKPEIRQQFGAGEHALWQQAARVEIGHAERLGWLESFARV